MENLNSQDTTDKETILIGLDEAGRGPVAGPIFAGAFAIKVSNLFALKKEALKGLKNSKNKTDQKRFKRLLSLISHDLDIAGNEGMRNNSDKINYSNITETLKHLQDSKKVTAKNRKLLYKEVCKIANIGFSSVSAERIDQKGIQNCNVESIKKALNKAKKNFNQKGRVLVICDFVQKGPSLWNKITKGDSKSFVIAFASIIAKVERDNLMESLHNKFPQYGWNSNVGYGTKKHLEAIKKYGLTKYHRKSFLKKYMYKTKVLY